MTVIKPPNPPFDVNYLDMRPALGGLMVGQQATLRPRDSVFIPNVVVSYTESYV